MAGYEVKLIPPKQLMPPSDMKLCATRRVVRAAGVLEWAEYVRSVEAAGSELARRPTAAMVAGAEQWVASQNQFMRDSANVLRVLWRIKKLETGPAQPSEDATLTVPAFELSSELQSGYRAVLGCTACNSGFEPSPDICANDDAAVRAQFLAGALGEVSPRPAADPAS